MLTWQKMIFALGLAMLMSLAFAYILGYALYGIARFVVWYNSRKNTGLS